MKRPGLGVFLLSYQCPGMVLLMNPWRGPWRHGVLTGERRRQGDLFERSEDADLMIFVPVCLDKYTCLAYFRDLGNMVAHGRILYGHPAFNQLRIMIFLLMERSRVTGM